jgi:hypothetical protein
MYPNPQDALPLPSRPNIEQYKKLAKDLVKSCKSVDPAAIHVWAVRWIEALSALQQESERLRRTEIEVRADQVEPFARKKLSPSTGHSSRCALADAHFVIARAHGFVSWPTFAKHIELLAQAASPVSAFEAAADAIVTGDVATIKRLLREHPDLIQARSTREHRATLLHYVSANGVVKTTASCLRRTLRRLPRSCSMPAPTCMAAPDAQRLASSQRVGLPPLRACSWR